MTSSNEEHGARRRKNDNDNCDDISFYDFTQVHADPYIAKKSCHFQKTEEETLKCESSSHFSLFRVI